MKLSSPLQERTKSILPFHTSQNALQTLEAVDSGQRHTSRLATRGDAKSTGSTTGLDNTQRDCATKNLALIAASLQILSYRKISLKLFKSWETTK